MGQIIGSDKIAIPSHSSGTITLPPSLLTLGGRQYRTSQLTRLISADVTLTANTLYFVYGVNVSSVPALRISLQAPSVYKLSNPTAKLVAAFYSNGLGSVEFGSFVTIDGVPTTLNQIQFSVSPAFSGSNGTATMANSVMEYHKKGNDIFIRAQLRVTKGTASGSLAATGIPFVNSSSGQGRIHCGTLNQFSSFTNETFFCRAEAPNTLGFVRVSGGNAGIGPIDASNMNAGEMDLQFAFNYLTTGLSTPLVDL